MAISLNKRRFFLVHPRTHQKAPSIPSPPDNIRDWCSQRHVSATGDITGLGFWDVGERMRCSRCVCHHVCRLLLYECSEPTTVFSLDRDLSVSYPGLSNLLQLFPASMLIWHSVQVAEKRALHQLTMSKWSTNVMISIPDGVRTCDERRTRSVWSSLIHNTCWLCWGFWFLLTIYLFLHMIPYLTWVMTTMVCKQLMIVFFSRSPGLRNLRI